MRKKVLLILSLVFFVLPIGISYAHFESVDGSITGELHMDPDDEPIVGSTTSFHIDIKDSENKFDIESCDCTVNIIDNENILHSYKHTDKTVGLYEINFNHTIPKKGVYVIEVIGSPINDKVFQKFSLSFNARFEKELPVMDQYINSVANYRSYILFGIVALLFGLAIILKKIFR